MKQNPAKSRSQLIIFFSLVLSILISLMLSPHTFAEDNVFSGVEDIEIEENTQFNLLDGVSAFSQTGEPLQVSISDIDSTDKSFTYDGSGILMIGTIGTNYIVEYLATSSEDSTIQYTASRTIKSVAKKEDALPTDTEETKAEVNSSEYNVWFDGTIGLGKHSTNSKFGTYYLGATDTCEQTKNGKIILPTESGQTINYGYTLNGWYDITHGKYYGKDQLGTKVEISSDTVFYADWISSNYNLGKDTGKEVVSNQPDTSDFITNDVFDYNELFNLQSLNLISSQVDANDHNEAWALNNGNGSLDFLFLNWSYYDITHEYSGTGYKSIAFPNGVKEDASNRLNDYIVQGILSDSKGNLTVKGKNILNTLFSRENSLGKQYLGTGNYLYQYVNDSNNEYNGYYYYDSSKNGTSYNASENRFYVYNEPEYIHGQTMKTYSSGWGYWADVDHKKDTTAFLPFNDSSINASTGTTFYNSKDGSTNYGFGMKSSISFWLPNTPGTGGNIADTGKQMEFKFSGDDDVWVFVDDKLALDLGGIHGKKSGSINFSTGIVTADGKQTQLDSGIGEGNHTLTVYYLERGSSESNCSIYFNIAPKYHFTINKKDIDNQTALQGAEFSIYENAECTDPAQLWDTVEDSLNKNSKNVFVTNENGTIDGYGLVAGHTYYIKETKVPTDYEDMSDKVIKFTLNQDGTISNENTDEKLIASDGITADPANRKISIIAKNEKIKRTVTVQKKWNDTDNQSGIRPNSIQVQLYADDQPAGEVIELSEQNQWTYTWKNLVKYKNGNEINYTVKEIAVPDGYHSDITQQENGDFIITNTKYPDLLISKTVTGEAGDKTKIFTFDIEIKNADGTGINGEYNYLGSVKSGYENESTPPENGSLKFIDGKAQISLSHGQQITIKELPLNCTYTVTEREENKDNYSTTYNGKEDSATTPLNEDTEVHVVNHKEFIPNTGVISNNQSIIVGIIFSIIGILLIIIIYFLKSRKRLK